MFRKTNIHDNLWLRALRVLVGIMLAQRCRRWPSITSASGQCIVLSSVSGVGVRWSTLKDHWLNGTCFRKVYNIPGDRLVLGQHRRRLTGIEPAMGCNVFPTLNRNLVGRPPYQVHRRQVLNECWPASVMVVEGIHVEDIYELVLFLSLNISRTFRILAHEEDQYTDFLSIALKQTKAGPRSSRTCFMHLHVG